MDTINIDVMRPENRNIAITVNKLSDVLLYNNYAEYSKFVLEIFPVNKHKDESEKDFLIYAINLVIEKLSKLNF